VLWTALRLADDAPQRSIQDFGDALALVLLALDHDPPRFDKAAVRWHARLCREAPLTLDEAQLALSALQAMGARHEERQPPH
jgi:hypothetical protein